MSPTQYIVASLRHYWRIHEAVGVGVCTATAVLTGALLVGDSVRGSLRGLVVERLGRVDQVLIAPQPFRESLAAELSDDAQFREHFDVAIPALFLNGSVEIRSGERARRLRRAQIVGSTEEFWKLGEGGPSQPLTGNQVAVSAALAQELDVRVGDEVLVRLPNDGAIPGDSPLGNKTDTVLGVRCTIAAVLARDGLGSMQLEPSQRPARNAFLALATLQRALDRRAEVNALVVAAHAAGRSGSADAEQALRTALQPTWDDFGIRVEQLAATARDETPADSVAASDDGPLQQRHVDAYWRITSSNLVLPDELVAAAHRADKLARLQPVVTYLANTIRLGDRQIPYSTITGINSTDELGPFWDSDGAPFTPADDEIILNRWAADDLQAEIGDLIEVRFYEPETTHGRLVESSMPQALRLIGIAEMVDRNGRPTAAADANFTPPLEGVTDKRTISNWQVPFELVEQIREVDEAYWADYKTTPKAFVNLSLAEKLWHTRWGTVSCLRLPVDDNTTASEVMAQVEVDPAVFGFSFRPIKRIGLEAAAGTTPFEALFLGFSFFLMVAALLLIALMFQLGVAERSSEIGLLASVGFPSRRLTQLILGEAWIVSAIGAACGLVGAVVYAALLLTGLQTLWLGAIGTPFLDLHVTARSLLIGWLLGTCAAVATILWSLRRLLRTAATRLLAHAASIQDLGVQPTGWSNSPVSAALWLIVVVLVACALYAADTLRALFFFGSGAAALTALLLMMRRRLVQSVAIRGSLDSWSLRNLALQNLARHPGRSTLTVGLVAAASFLVIAISAFRLQPTEAGTGGFALVADSDQPILHDLTTEAGRAALPFSAAENEQLARWHVEAFRVRDGDDSSCLNLYQTRQSRVLGVPVTLSAKDRFSWAAVNDELLHPATASPWELLSADVGEDVIPAILDANTARYGLKLSLGSRWQIRDEQQRPVTLEVVALLQNSMLQGDVLVSERRFLELFAESSGRRFFLLRPDGPASAGAAQVREVLEGALSDYGFVVEPAVDRLARFLSVQNTYLSTFQSLGALGLLLGTLGLAAAQVRSVVERRRELALLRSTGFRAARITRLVMTENALLVAGGLFVGAAAAALAVLPHWLLRNADVPWWTLVAMPLIVAVCGLLATWCATRRSLDAPLLTTLRSG